VNDYELYLVQLLFYMAKAGKSKGMLAVYERPSDFSEVFDKTRLQIFNISANNYTLAIQTILEEVDKFVRDREKLVNNPFLTEEELLPSDLAEASSKVVALEKRLQEFKEMEKEYERQKESLLKAMQEANVKTWRTNGGYLITVIDAIPSTTKTVTTIDENALKEKHPRIYKQFLVENTVTKAGKKAYLKITAPKEEKK
jgi:hypothetical protein